MSYTYSDELYSDLHKDAYGFRPGEGNYAAWEAMTADEKQARWERMLEDLDRSMREEENAQKVATEVFEQRVQNLIETGAKNRETALRWIHQAEGTDGDDEYLCYCCGLPYGYFRKVA